MQKIKEFPNSLIAITFNELRVLVDGDPELKKMMDGSLFDDNCLGTELPSFPKAPGVYLATVEFWFEQGYYDGYKAPGESDYDFILSNVRKVAVVADVLQTELDALRARVAGIRTILFDPYTLSDANGNYIVTADEMQKLRELLLPEREVR